jgi:diacylglycerol kinase (ATP)
MQKGSWKYIFIINPGSGNKKLRNWEKLIATNLSSRDYEILYTRYPGHSASILSQYQSVDEHKLCIIAVGGDGTINDLIPTILRSQSYLGVIPTGSGNGLARHLKIPLDAFQAIKRLNAGNLQTLDLIKINDHYYSNSCGIGFSALVTKHFGVKGSRGFRTYFKLALALYKSSRSFDIKLNETLYTDAWIVEIANSSQLGNNAIVSPHASVNDGIIDILIVRKPSVWQVPAMIAMVLTGNILKLRLSKLIKATEISIALSEEQHYHVDGEYMGMIQQANVQILPSAIQIIH